MHHVVIKNISIGPKRPLCLISGPCVIESEASCLKAAETLKRIAEKVQLPLIFKSSYDKANRSSGDSFRGVGIKEGLRILGRVQREFGLPVVSDVHTVEEATLAGEVLDLIQIPAFLCRQTDLVLAAARTGKPLQVKKGQFMAPWDMKNVVEKIESAGNKNILLVDRGTSFGYNNLVSDMRAIPVMRALGYPVCFDATHAVQLPGGLGDKTGGQREFVVLLARAALASGASALFMEAHENPEKALSDASSMISFKELESVLPPLKALYDLVQRDWE